MTILDLIEILQLNKENNIFTSLPPGPYFEDHSIFEVSSKKIIFYEGLTLSEFYNSRKEVSYALVKYIQKNIESVYENKRELLRYFSVFQLLIAIDKATGHDDCVSYDQYLETAKQYVAKINQAIIENYQTDDIQDMKDLIYILSNKPLYRELFFHVQVFDYNKNQPCPNKESKDYYFGNKRFHNEFDIVGIKIYNDFVALCPPKEIRIPKKELNQNENLSLEQKIITAFDCWETDFNL